MDANKAVPLAEKRAEQWLVALALQTNLTPSETHRRNVKAAFVLYTLHWLPCDPRDWRFPFQQLEENNVCALVVSGFPPEQVAARAFGGDPNDLWTRLIHECLEEHARRIKARHNPEARKPG